MIIFLVLNERNIILVCNRISR